MSNGPVDPLKRLHVCMWDLTCRRSFCYLTLLQYDLLTYILHYCLTFLFYDVLCYMCTLSFLLSHKNLFYSYFLLLTPGARGRLLARPGESEPEKSRGRGTGI